MDPACTAFMVARSNSIGMLMKQCRRRLAHVGTNSDLLYSELSSLDGNRSARIGQNASRQDGIVMRLQEATHRQNSQERSLASVLQPDHGDVHLGRPRRGEQSVSGRHAIGGRDFWFSWAKTSQMRGIKWRIRHPERCVVGQRKQTGRRTRTGGAASRRCDGRGSPWPWSRWKLTRGGSWLVGRTGGGGDVRAMEGRLGTLILAAGHVIGVIAGRGSNNTGKIATLLE